MYKSELDEIMAMPSVAIIAPAGHGKTEMITDFVNAAQGKQLLLTHTNAGVDALAKRLKKRNISSSKYTVTTIAAFCISWCVSYPETADFDLLLSPFDRTQTGAYYNQLYSGAASIFKNRWAGRVLLATYTGVIIDEYQDCTKDQHEIMLAISSFLPVRVLGDPLQGIFYWAGELVDWFKLEFPNREVHTKPWRWEKSNPELGAWLMSVRSQMMPILEKKPVRLNFGNIKDSVEIITGNTFNGYILLRKLEKYDSVLYLAKWEREQLSFSNKMGGIFQHDEKQDSDELFKYAVIFDNAESSRRGMAVLDFVKECATHVGTETSSFRKHLDRKNWNFAKIKKHQDLGKKLVSLCDGSDLVSLADTLAWFGANSRFKFYRKELYKEMLRSIRYAADHEMSIYQATVHIRMDLNLQKRYSQFRFLSSRTVLAKGLEFDCVIIDMRDPLETKDFYVALTRAKKMIYIISNSSSLLFQP